ncbi:MAG: heme-binding protein [Xanthomonadales bacterium]|nr:heme-binding protein [Xanthomonadales bacterium]
MAIEEAKYTVLKKQDMLEIREYEPSIVAEVVVDGDFEATGDPVWARYNAPFTPWFMRRNEILIPIAPL